MHPADSERSEWKAKSSAFHRSQVVPHVVQRFHDLLLKLRSQAIQGRQQRGNGLLSLHARQRRGRRVPRLATGVVRQVNQRRDHWIIILYHGQCMHNHLSAVPITGIGGIRYSRNRVRIGEPRGLQGPSP